MRQYLTYFKLIFITNLQYRMEALAGICTQIFFGLINIMLYLSFYESGGNPPMQWQELVNYIWLQQAFYTLIYPLARDKDLLDMIKNGNLAYELVRPQSFYLKWYIKMLAKRLVAVLLRCLPLILLAVLLPYPFHLSRPYSINNFIIFIIALILGLILVTSTNLLIHILTIFTLDEKGTITTYGVISEILSGGVIPLPFLPSWLRAIAELLPFRIYSGSIPLEEAPTLLLISVIWIIITLSVGYIITQSSLRRTVIQGG